MKKFISLMLSFLITSSLVVGCSNTEEDNKDEAKDVKKVTVNVGAPEGLPAIAIAKITTTIPIMVVMIRRRRSMR